VSAAWDFPNEGITSDSLALPNPEPYDLGQLDDVDQYVFSVVRKKTPQLERQSLSRGELVLNGGLQLIYRHQTLANDRSSTIERGRQLWTTRWSVRPLRVPTRAALASPAPSRRPTRPRSYVRRGANAWIPDLWLELKYQKFRFAAEVATVQGSIANIAVDNQTTRERRGKLQDPSWGVATELEQKLVEDKLNLGFRFGWSSGDPDVDG
jgi:uncharacterized protein (TIGR04551 family)